MTIKGMNLVWIVVKDFEKAIEFYTKTIGLKLLEKHDDFGWAELSGPEGSRLGIAKENADMIAGKNAVPTITVEDIEQARDGIAERGAQLLGDIVTIPDVVSMQLFQDGDGNQMQLVQQLG
jgi:predicted enzyme related to lactoylglutathione lyase